MKKAFILFVAVFVAIGAYFALSQAPSEQNKEGKKVSVVTTLFPLYDFAKAVGGEHVEATLLLPPGVEAHSFEPKPSDIMKIDRSDVFVYTGEAMEPWAIDIAASAAKKGVRIVDASAGIGMMAEEAEHEEGGESEGGHAFEWAGSFHLDPGEYRWSFAKTGGVYAEPSMKMAVAESSGSGSESIETVESSAEILLERASSEIRDGEEVVSGKGYVLRFDESKDITGFVVKISRAGTYVFFTEHMPTEFESDEHFFKDAAGNDIEPIAQEPEEHGHHHHHHGGMDPHIWLDFDNAAKMASSIAEALAEKDPAHAAEYRVNAEAYRGKLSALDARYRSALASCQTRTIVYGGHYAFGYLAHRYGLSYEAAQGFSPDAEPSAKDLALLVEQVKSESVKTVFYEELASPKIAETIASETGAKLLLLNAAHNIAKEDYNRNVSFLSIMEENLAHLSEGLGCSK